MVACYCFFGKSGVLLTQGFSVSIIHAAIFLHVETTLAKKNFENLLVQKYYQGNERQMDSRIRRITINHVERTGYTVAT